MYKSEAMTIIRIAHNAITAKLVDVPKEVSLIVSDVLTYTVEGSEHMTKRPGWDGKSSFFSFKTQSFPAGFVHRVQARLTSEGYKVVLVKKPLPEPLGDVTPAVDAFGEDPRYSYQMETVRKLEKFGMMIAQLATGGGKSRVARLAYKRINRKTLFLTTRSALLYQFHSACVESFGEQEVGIVGDGTWDADKQLVCGMVQTLAQRLQNPTANELFDRHITNAIEKENREVEKLKLSLAKAKVPIVDRNVKLAALRAELELKRATPEQISQTVVKKLKVIKKQRDETIELLQQFELVIAEEAHEAGGNSYFDVMGACRNAYYRLALTATPFMRGDAESNMRLMGVSGGIGIRVTEKQLIDLGILAKPIFKIMPTQKPKSLFRSSAYTKAYDVGIVNHEWRNRYIAAECIRMAKYGLTTMILVQRKNHGENLVKLLTKAGLKCKFIKGENDNDERQRALEMLGTGEISVLIGTNILDVGVDVPSVGCIALAGGGKAEVANRQRIGRGLRAKKSGPNICFVLDFADEHNQHLQGHAIQRRAIVTETPGFSEGLLPSGEDWKLTDYGFSKLLTA
ncbi:DEAD/DEAH box helicase [Shewanella glacialipiscicola]|uniref:DEAD/DEAH box helicase n=1 Tax=Shewanella glacialipiscicola TaxID=614069 RepID=UPI003D79D6BD